MRTGLLLVGHGTRDPRGVAEFLSLGQMLRARCGELPSAACFLELAEPSIAVGTAELVAAGVERIIVAPLLLFSAGHAKRDVPEAVAAALIEHPKIVIEQLPALNSHPQILALSQRRLQQAPVIGPTQQANGERLLLVVGRGSSDAAATAALRQFAARRATQARVAGLLCCFVTGQQPNLRAGLELAAAAPQSVILVQPHLLFAGLLRDEIAAAVREYAERYPQKEWRMAEPLGPEPELAAAVGDLFSRVIDPSE